MHILCMHVCMHVYIWGMSRSIQPCNMKNRDIYWIKYKVQEIWYIGQWCLCPLQSRHLRSSHSFPTCHQLPCHIFLNLIDSLKSLPFQRWFYFWEKPEVARHWIWAVAGLSHLGDLMFHQKPLQEMWCMSGHIVMMKLPITSCP